ncbi:putative capsid precursor [Drosophila kikkawai virus 1]|nr:putative capsid precursor [Drosophila kikkawai virus 1]
MGSNITNDNDSNYKDTKQVITFQNQGQTVADEALAKHVDLPTSYLDMSIVNDKMHTINTFLERPLRIWSGQFTTSNTQGQNLFSGTFPDVLLSDPMYNEKIKGFVGLRANIEVTVQVNAQKFQQGRLRLQYLPYQKYLTTKSSMINATLTGQISCPGVDIDICGGSNPQSRIAQATFVIPYVSPHTYINLITGHGTMGQINLLTYSPLISGSAESTSCEVTIWARFLNPKLAFPTGAAPYIAPALRTHVAQVRGEAKQLKKTGVISETLGKVAETLRSASRIPVIGQYMAIPEWIANSGEALCKLFGWSKPTLPMDTKLRTVNCMANYNGQDSSHKMALSADNEIDTPAGIGGSDLDEMALSSIFKIPSYWDQFSWTTSDTITDKILWVDPISPLKFKTISGTTNGISMTPVGYIANCFGLWRGSLIYTFKLIKTGFHAGRLRVFYVPYEKATNLVVGSAPVNEIEKNYQIVIDIAESDTFTFKVPYVATKPWFNTTSLGSVSDDIQTSTGYLVVTVLNELQAVSTVSPSINILVEVSGGDDLTFACPQAPQYLPGVPTATSAPSKVHEAQVLGTAVEVPRNEAQLLYDPNSISEIDPLTNWSPEAHCIGEKVVSVRQLVKRSNYVGSIVENRTNFNAAARSDMVNTLGVINPYGMNYSSPISGIDYISYFSYIYSFFRGGMRLKIAGMSQSAEGLLPADEILSGTWMSKPYSTSNIFVKMINALNPLMTSLVTQTQKMNNIIGKVGCNGLQFFGTNSNVNVNMHPLFTNASSTVVVSNMIEGITEVEVPYYNSTHITPCVDNGSTSSMFPVSTMSEAEGSYPLPVLVFGTMPYNTNFQMYESIDPHYSTIEASTSTAFHVYRQAADDFGFHYLMGIPTMIIETSPSVNLFKPTVP